MKESTMQKIGVSCVSEERSRSLEEEFSLTTDDGLPVIHFNPELIEGSESLI